MGDIPVTPRCRRPRHRAVCQSAGGVHVSMETIDLIAMAGAIALGVAIGFLVAHVRTNRTRYTVFGLLLLLPIALGYVGEYLGPCGPRSPDDICSVNGLSIMIGIVAAPLWAVTVAAGLWLGIKRLRSRTG